MSTVGRKSAILSTITPHMTKPQALLRPISPSTPGRPVEANDDPREANHFAAGVRRRSKGDQPRVFDPPVAVAAAAASTTRPVVIAESADASSAEAIGDSPCNGVILAEEPSLMSVIPAADPASVEPRCALFADVAVFWVGTHPLASCAGL